MRFGWLGFLLGVTVHAESAPVLTAVYGEFVTAPALIRSVDHVPASGFLLDIYQELAATLQRPLALKSFQRTDIATALLKGEADVYCRANPAWYPQPMLRWSPPLFSYADLLLSRLPVSSLPPGQLVGTVTGYRYPELERRFQDGTLRRKDYTSPELLAEAVLKGQLDTLLMSEVEAYYLLPVSQFQQQKLGAYQLHCIYAPTLSSAEREQLDRHISHQVAAGAYPQLLKKYVWQLALPDVPER